jgi:predicted SprT family Zn-dependent metalloprotease
MKLEDAENLALTLMEDNGVGTWSFHFDNAKRRCGACFYSRRTITLSRHFVTMNDEAEVRDTILHEIAHAFAGAKAGHGVHWQRAAMQLGARPERCAQNVDMPEGNIEGVCAPDCTTRHTRHRMPPKRLANAYSCNRCYEPVTWVRVN